MTVREPRGVIGAITPFNVPLNLALHKIGPALASGNAVVHKPAEKTPLSAVRLGRAIQEAGAPKGAYNVINGSGPVLGPLMAEHPEINMLTFTGSAPVGKALMAKAGFKKVTLELGNNSAVIVEPDADLDLAVARTVAGGFAHSGQVCISVQRVYVHESIVDDFLAGVKKGAEALKIGHPLEETTDVSSLISEAAAIRVVEWIGEALVGGAKLVTGGGRRFSTVQPTVLTNVPANAKVSCEEVFGPVIVVHPYRELGQAVLAVNDSPFGLQAGIFTPDISKAFATARKLQVGGVLINEVPLFRADHMPYGGTKDSGTGREGPSYAMEEMTETKVIVWKA
jgi:acyl-CoA reductase-like NAD-dependent aldehyde dehydrogenase